MYAAFPRSEYYDGSDAHTLHRWTAHLDVWASHVHDDGLNEIVKVAVFPTTHPALRGIPTD
jgi:hypothetical protein